MSKKEKPIFKNLWGKIMLRKVTRLAVGSLLIAAMALTATTTALAAKGKNAKAIE